MKQLAWILLLVSASCNAPENGNVDTARKLFEAFNRHAWTVMASCYAEKAQFLDPSYGIEYVTKTRSETVEKYHGFQQQFPDIHDQVIGMYPSGDKVIVEFVSTGTSGDSINFRLPIISVLTFQDGKIVKDATYYDQR